MEIVQGATRRSNEGGRPPAEVFLNLPYDQNFQNMFLAYIAGVSAVGLVPRAALELPEGVRLDRIFSLLCRCEYSIHDLSRVELDRRRPATPRFNMPFELGLAVAHEKSRHDHAWFVFEASNRRILKSLSDLNGTDVFVHHGKVNGVFSEICNAFVRTVPRRPTVQQMQRIHRNLRLALPVVLRESGSKTIFAGRPFKELSTIASGLADAIVLGESGPSKTSGKQGGLPQ